MRASVQSKNKPYFNQVVLFYPHLFYQRIDIAVDFTEGESFAIESLAYDRMTFLKAKRETSDTQIH
jgi:hypothetical protein